MADNAIANTPAAGQAAIAATPEAAAPSTAAQARAAARPLPSVSAKKKYQLKVDGQTENFEFDPTNEAEVTKQLQLARVSQKRMQQFSEYENNVKNLFDLLQKDPIKVLSDPRLGVSEETRKKMAEMIINNEITEMQKSPEQKEKERLQRQYEDLKQQHEAERKAREQSEMSRLQQQYAQQFDNDISDAINSSGLPKTSRTVRYFAEAMMFCVQNNIDLGARDLAPLIRKQTMGDFRDIVNSLPDEEFEDFVGKDNISRLRKRSIQKIKQVAATAQQVKDTGKADAPKPTQEDKKVSARDFFKGLGGANRGIK
jgi:hypothetical protein